jgi:hypothetical protein
VSRGTSARVMWEGWPRETALGALTRCPAPARHPMRATRGPAQSVVASRAAMPTTNGATLGASALEHVVRTPAALASHAWHEPEALQLFDRLSV